MRRHRRVPSHTGSETESRRGVIWIFDGTPGRAAQKAAEFGGKAFDTLDEALADPGIDAAVICTPTRSHCDLAVRALAAGKHVLCEKPMAVSADDARKMIAASEKANKKLMISHNQRRYHPHIKAKELLDRGRDRTAADLPHLPWHTGTGVCICGRYQQCVFQPCNERTRGYERRRLTQN